MEKVHDTIPLDRPHPSLGQCVLLPRITYNQGGLLNLVEHSDARTVVAPLAHSLFSSNLTLFEPARPPGLVLDPETHFLGLDPAGRPSNFRKLPFGRMPRLQPDHDALTPTEIRDFAAAVLQEQRQRGATLLLTPYFLCGPAHSEGRKLDVLLARASARLFAQQGMAEPPVLSGRNAERQLFATVALRLKDLSSAAVVHELIDVYCEVAVDGYWVRIAGFDEQGEPAALERASAFMRGLERTSQRPVVSCGPGPLALPLLAGGLSAVSMGVATGERFNEPRDAREKRTGGGVASAYHPAFLRAFSLKGENAEAAFGAEGCGCGEHPAQRPPSAREAASHAFRVRMAEVAELRRLPPDERITHLRRRLSSASWLAADADVPQPPARAMQVVLAAFGDGGTQQVFNRPAG